MAKHHLFTEMCCVGASVSNHIPVTNHGEHWLLLTFSVQQLLLDGQVLEEEEEEGERSVFSVPGRNFVGPMKSESVEVGVV
jgi:hypothetical protein